jgi:ribose/xylose/arabinose/galactoside ABC-type transport system permease subunit
MEASFVVTLVLMVAIFASDLWVYADVTHLQAQSRPIVATLGTVEIARPEMWLILVIIFWVFFFPLYLVARRVS